MRIFVTGGSGFLGFNLVRKLVELNHEVIILARQENAVFENLKGKVSIIKSSVELLDDINCSNFDICIHFAWGGVNRQGISDSDIQKHNLINTLKVLTFAYKHGCTTFLDAGSRQEYAPSIYALTENSICNPISEYGKWKLESYYQAKEFCQSYGIQYLHFRIFSVYGHGDHPWSLISSAIHNLSNNIDMELGLCQHRWSFLYIRDFVDAIISTIDSRFTLSEHEIFNLGSSDVRCLSDFINEIGHIVDTTSHLLYGAFKQNSESVFSVIPDVDKIQSIIGWREKYVFSEGIRDIINLKLDTND